MSNELFIVLEGTKIVGVYRYRDDAAAHSQVCGGRFVVQSIRETLPTWVQVMIDEAKDKARMQNPVRRDHG